jgi:hypothetical protein
MTTEVRVQERVWSFAEHRSLIYQLLETRENLRAFLG